MMGHEQVLDLIPLYALATLEPDEMAALDAHLELCDGCRRLLDDNRAAAARLVPDSPPPQGLWERIEMELTPHRRQGDPGWGDTS